MALRSSTEGEPRDLGRSIGKILPIQGSEGFNGFLFQEKKELKFGEVRVRSMNLDDPLEVKTYVDWLNDHRDWLHFAHPPRDVEGLKEKANKEPRDHFLTVTRVERVEGKLTEVMVGGARLTDNVKPENEHWITLVIVDPDKRRYGIGDELIKGIADWGQETRTYDGRKRDHLHLAVNLEIPGDKIMLKLANKYFNPVQTKLPREVNYWLIKYTDAHEELYPELENEILFGQKLAFKELTRRDGRVYDEAEMEDGTKVEIVKKPTQRFGFSYVDDIETINPDHPVLIWQKQHPKKVQLPEEPTGK